MQGTWAPLFYEHVFCKIDEAPFSCLYCLDNGRPNFPVNILLSLEFIKHMKDYTDEDILEQFRFNYQIMTNIKLAGRLSLAYDVLSQALAACPPELLTDSLKHVLEPEYKTKVLYRKGKYKKKIPLYAVESCY